MFPTRLAKYAAMLLGGSTLVLLYGTNFRLAKPPPLPDMPDVPRAVGLPDSQGAPSFAAQRIPEGHVVASPEAGGTTNSDAMVVYKWVDDAGEWHFSNTPPKGQIGAITQEVTVRNLVTQEQSAILAGVDPHRVREAERVATVPEAEVEEAPSLDNTVTRLGELVKPVTDSIKPVTDTLGPIVDAYKDAPQLIDQANDVAAKMEQRQQALQQMEEMIK